MASAGLAATRYQVLAQLNYLAPMAQTPRTYTYPAPAGEPQSNRRNEPHPVTIGNGRLLGDLSLDRQGFEMVPHRTAMVNFYDAQEVQEVYYGEVRALLARHTGAARVDIFDHVVRNSAPDERAGKGAREPVSIVHNDYTLRSLPERVRIMMPQEAPELLHYRVAEVNVWRAIKGPIEQWPLAVCDARSIALSDAIGHELVYRDRVGETYSFTFNPAHRWYFFPGMEPNEALLLKCYDSVADGRARFTAHCAFEDPESPPGAAPRESIEVRALLFFGPEG